MISSCEITDTLGERQPKPIPADAVQGIKTPSPSPATATVNDNP